MAEGSTVAEATVQSSEILANTLSSKPELNSSTGIYFPVGGYLPLERYLGGYLPVEQWESKTGGLNAQPGEMLGKSGSYKRRESPVRVVCMRPILDICPSA